MKKMIASIPKQTLTAIAVGYCILGLLVACVDMGDYWPVGPTSYPGGAEPDVPGVDTETVPYNDANRSLGVFRDNANTYIEWRNEDIAKVGDRIALLEGIASGGGEILLGEVGKYAGPFGPLLMLIGGRAIRRRGDSTPDELRKEKEDSYNAGLEAGRAMAAGLVNES